MPVAPKVTEAKLKRIHDAWELHAKNTQFAGMAFADFASAIEPSFKKREELAELEAEAKAKASERDTVDVASLKLAADVARAVAGDKNFGPDSTLYEAMGYVRSSERKSGLTRKKKNGGNEEKKA